jgi:cell division inhibitor SepF
MSWLDGFKRITQPYGDDEYEDEFEDEGFEEEEGVRNADPRRIEFEGSTSDPKTGRYSAPSVGMSKGNGQQVVLFRPNAFNDSAAAADDLRSGKAVIANMENVDKALSRRVVDFLTGCAYALDGKVNKIAQSTYLFCPHNMDVVGDLETAPSETESYT